MTPAYQTPTEHFLTACLAYCMTWELAGARASEHWAGIRSYVAREGFLSERQRWTSELYEEAAPTAQEERSLVARLEVLAVRPRDMQGFRDGVLALLPEAMQESAAVHSLLRPLAAPSNDYGKLKRWLTGRRKRRSELVDASVPISEREVDFGHFLELPYFVEGFRRFWRVPPKYRNNRETRVLVCLGAVGSHMIQANECMHLEKWAARLGEACHFTSQTRMDLTELMEAMVGYSYDTQDLAYHLSVDAEAVDNENLRQFIKRYSAELSDFARELARDVELCSA